MPSLWKVDPATLPPASPRRRKLGRKPLIDLVALQQAIADGALGEEEVTVVTQDCVKDLRKFPWSYRDLLDCVQCVRPFRANAAHDFRGAEWCRTSADTWVPCDVYVTRYDEQRRCWSPQGLEIYLKFSITRTGQLALLLISAHLPM